MDGGAKFPRLVHIVYMIEHNYGVKERPIEFDEK